MGRILAIDFGKKRTGLAVTDLLRITANPLLTIDTKNLLQWLQTYFATEQVDEVVIGHPRQMNGEDSESMLYIRPFMAEFRRTFPDTPLVEYDERFTSVIAHQAMLAGGMKKKDRQDKAAVDSLAACIILQGYMDYKISGSLLENRNSK
ncbi:MAG TPA: Holliday junction resolvase RuvX [Bacteroidales bacterium]|nr:Holliday junction resolvase RuvX [Bacteroidales bacterium]